MRDYNPDRFTKYALDRAFALGLRLGLVIGFCTSALAAVILFLIFV